MMEDKVFLLTVGSFNPPTFGHLRMLEDAKFFLEERGKKVLGGIMSPVSDAYEKPSLISSNHRLQMTVAATNTSDWICVDDWECSKSEWTTTLNVLKYHDKNVKKIYGEDVDVLLLVGADVIDTFPMRKADGSPVWDLDDLIELMNTGLVVQSRAGYDPKKTLESIGELSAYIHQVLIIEDALYLPQLSSTSVRAAVAKGASIKYLTPDAVIEYINYHKLYK